MAQAMVSANGIEICYESLGNPSDPALVLIMGLGAQLVTWGDEFCELLVGRGFRVIRFDNRDSGLSTKTDGPAPKLRFVDGRWGIEGTAAYGLADMAADTVGLLDALGIDAAHVVGESLGGMIAQHVALSHPDRTLSLTVIMSTTGNSRVGRPTPEAVRALRTTPPPERDAYIESMVGSLRVISGRHFDEEQTRRTAAAMFDRCYWPRGSAHQLVASVADGNRTERLASIRCPTLVIHGREDPLIDLSGGAAIADAIPGARLLVLDEMAHDLPEPLWGEIVGAIADITDRADPLTGPRPPA